MDDFHEVNKSIGFYMGHGFRAVKHVMAKAFAENGYNITSEQGHILMILWAKDGRTQQEITETVMKEKTTVARIIDGLERRNLLVRIQDKTDRRHNLIYLTNEGKLLKEKLIPIAIKVRKKAIEGFSEEELENFRNFFDRVIENLKQIKSVV